MSREGARALETTIKQMKLEVPLLTLATEFTNKMRDKTCMEIFLDELNLS